MQSSDKDINIKRTGEDIDKDIKAGSTITDPEEKELRKYDDWHSHKHEKHKEPDTDFRATELHGVVGKEIKDVLEIDKMHHMQEEKAEHKKEKKSGMSSETKGMSSESKGMSSQSQGMSSQSKGMSSESKGMSSQSQGTSSQSQGMSSQTKESSTDKKC